jgi:protein-S-isoprenylcysteine O-methyltransferase Ste14
MPLFPKSYAALVQRLRVPGGFVLLACFGFLAHPSLPSILASIPVILTGLGLRGWAAGHLEKDRNLADSGPYAYTRNPLYLGSFIVALGFAVAASSWILAVIVVAVFLGIYLPVMEREEEHLLAIFPAYVDYAARVPLLWPKPARQGSQVFRMTVYLKNEEYKAALGVALCLAVLGAKLYLTMQW